MSRGLGSFGETWTVGYLTRLGYRIVDRNVRYRRGEIDIVAYDGDVLVFVEVKCRRSTRYGSPESSLTSRRFSHLEAAIQEYLQDRSLTPASYRVDVMALELGAANRVIRSDLLRNVEPPRP